MLSLHLQTFSVFLAKKTPELMKLSDVIAAPGSSSTLTLAACYYGALSTTAGRQMFLTGSESPKTRLRVICEAAPWSFCTGLVS